MAEVKFSLNDTEVLAEQGQTILDVAKREGVFIPSLCHDPRLKPFGACRVCLVEVEGARNPLPACATQISEGMVVRTDTERIHALRKTVIELLISDHPLECVTCEKCGSCALQDLAYAYGITESKYVGAFHEVRPQEADPFIERHLDKCILCGRCVRICDEVEAAFAIDFGDRGFSTQITTPYLRSLKETPCEFCGQCISSCPVGALIEKPRQGKGRTWEVERTLTVCPYCGVGCTLELQTKDNRIVNVGSKVGVGINDGNLCVKGRFGYQFVGSAERLTTPLARRDGEFVPISWDEALRLVTQKLGDVKAEHGPDAIMGLASAKCTNEENYLFQKFMRCAVGTNNVDHCARLCHSSTVSGLLMAFGSGAMTNPIADFKNSDVILVIGSNTTEAHPIIGINIIQAVREHGTKLIVIDPRQIKLTKFARTWLSQKPGSDVAVLNGLMNIILSEGLHDQEFIDARTEGFAEFAKTIGEYTPEKVEEISGIPADDLRAAARLYAGAGAASIVYSMGITQHSTGTDNVLSVANLAMLTGNVGKPGAGVNPLRGQNNVQGSCDVGALPDVYTGYQKVADHAARAKFEQAWGVKLPVDVRFTVVEAMGAAIKGDIKAMYIMGENPMLSDPDIAHVEEALESLDFLVVQDIFLTETARFADLVLPSASFAEKEGTYTSTERRVQRLRPAVRAPGEAKQDWEIISMLSTALGYPMKYSGVGDILNEIASLTPIYGGITWDRVEGLGLQWPCPGAEHPGTPILHTQQFTRGQGKFHPVSYRAPAEQVDAKFPLVLTTGRLLNQYHTGTMVRKSAGIDEVFPIAHAEINPRDARKYGLVTGDEVVLETRRGRINAKALVTDKSPKGVVFMPFHFWEAAANNLTNPALDPIAKIPEFKVCAVRLEKV